MLLQATAFVFLPLIPAISGRETRHYERFNSVCGVQLEKPLVVKGYYAGELVLPDQLWACKTTGVSK